MSLLMDFLALNLTSQAVLAPPQQSNMYVLKDG